MGLHDPVTIIQGLLMLATAFCILFLILDKAGSKIAYLMILAYAYLLAKGTGMVLIGLTFKG